MMLGDLGAHVIKVESPGTGDDTRGYGPPFMTPPAGDGDLDGAGAGSDAPRRAESTYFLSCNRNKQSITLDLKSDDGRAVLTRLIERGDVLLENFRPGVLDRLGFTLDRMHEINPRLIVLSISGFGHDGPEGGRAGYDQIAQGEGGLMSLTGSGPDDPQRVGVPIGDLLAGMYGAYGVLAALHERERTGRGQLVRTSLLAAIVGVHAFQGTAFTVAGQVPRAQGNHHPSISPYGLFRCRDGALQIAVGSEGLWKKLCAGFDLDPDTAGMATNPERVTNRPAVIALLETAFAGYDLPDLLPKLAGLGVPAGQVRTLDQVYGWDQAASQGLLIDVDHATLGPIRLPGPPLRFFTSAATPAKADAEPGGPGETTPRTHHAPPTLGQHDAEVRAWLTL
jgi:crotonobetainyl-CoA:carnitine CoA-transferase CaiB-like acyl-CoA transferase